MRAQSNQDSSSSPENRDHDGESKARQSGLSAIQHKHKSRGTPIRNQPAGCDCTTGGNPFRALALDAQLERSFPQQPVTFLAGLLAPILMLFHLVGPVPADLGLSNGALRACQTTAHCASQTWESSNPTADFNRLSSLVRESPRTLVVDQSETYLHAEASSALFGFVDDLELFADSEKGQIQARSESRLGDADLGVNAARLAELRSGLER